jgi:uncharacterized repeat protein (TIGR01451 family)
MRKAFLALALGLTLVGVGAIAPAVASAAVDLRVEIADSPDPVDFEGNVTYDVSVTNDGADPASNVLLIDKLPPKNEAAFVSAPAPCTYATPSQASTEQAVVCTVGALVGGASVSYPIVIKTKSPGTITNSASAFLTEPDATVANNADTETTKVRRRYELSLGVNDSEDPIRIGHVLNYRISVLNGGPHNAEGVVLRDQLPDGVNFVGADDGCTHAGGVVTCNIGTLAGVASPFLPTAVTLDIQVRPTRAGDLTNVVLVNAPRTDDQDEGNRGNNTRVETTRVLATSPSLRSGACANKKSGTGAGNILLGTRRGDRLLGRGGRDRLFGYLGRDCLNGGAQGDFLTGGRGRDVVKGRGGADRIFVADGSRDVVICGPGFDRVQADRRDRLRGCERQS